MDDEDDAPTAEEVAPGYGLNPDTLVPPPGQIAGEESEE